VHRVKNFLPIGLAFFFGLFVMVGTGNLVWAADEKGFDSSTLVIETLDGQLAADAEVDDANDPLESINRAIFGFNNFMLEYLLRPVGIVYRDYIPGQLRDVIGNILHNLNTPAILANDLLQFEFKRALTTFNRFAINTTVGVLGIGDAAAAWGMEKHKEDLGQTFAVWGVGEGFYLVLPLLGPSNPRDAIGKFADGYLDPLNMWAGNTGRDYIPYSRTAVGGLHLYSGLIDELDEVKKTSVDYYATIRSLARQKRAAEVRNGKEADLLPIPDLGFDYDDFNDDLKQPAAAPAPSINKREQVSSSER
jgi:phospholipid-binding lipoprotein MlaA